jgi:hypothetical protein
MSISEFKNNEIINIKCYSCSSHKLRRNFSQVFSQIDRSSEDILEDIKIEAKKLAEKIKAGDSSTMSEVYGDEVNKLKFK